MQKNLSVDEIIDKCGGGPSLAERLGVTIQAFTGWRRAKRVPHQRVGEVVKASNGQLTREQVRPDLYDDLQ